jgi:hypothetical protein
MATRSSETARGRISPRGQRHKPDTPTATSKTDVEASSNVRKSPRRGGKAGASAAGDGDDGSISGIVTVSASVTIPAVGEGDSEKVTTTVKEISGNTVAGNEEEKGSEQETKMPKQAFVPKYEPIQTRKRVKAMLDPDSPSPPIPSKQRVVRSRLTKEEVIQLIT